MAEATKTEPSKTETKMRSPKSFALKRSGIDVVFDQDYSTDDAIAAQRAAGKNARALPLYLAQRICTFNGKSLTIGELKDQVRGADYFQLVGEILGGDDEADEDEAGN